MFSLKCEFPSKHFDTNCPSPSSISLKPKTPTRSLNSVSGNRTPSFASIEFDPVNRDCIVEAILGPYAVILPVTSIANARSRSISPTIVFFIFRYNSFSNSFACRSFESSKASKYRCVALSCSFAVERFISIDAYLSSRDFFRASHSLA